METVQISKSVDYYRVRSVSRDLNDEYTCSDSSEIQKFLSFVYEHQVFSANGLTLRNVHTNTNALLGIEF